MPVCRPALYRRNARQSAAPLLFRAGIHADGSPAKAGPAGDGMGRGAGGHDPFEAAQDRRYRACQRAAGGASTQFRVPLEGPIRSRLPRPALLSFTKASANSASTLDLPPAWQSHEQNPLPKAQTGDGPPETTIHSCFHNQKTPAKADLPLQSCPKSVPVTNAG